MIKVKNKMYQPLPLVDNNRTIIIPARKSMMFEKITPQMIALKSKGLLQIIRK